MKKILIFEGRETIGGGQIITKRICDILSSKYDVSVFIPGQDNGISSRPLECAFTPNNQHINI